MAGIAFTALEQMTDVISTGRFELDIAPISGVTSTLVRHFKIVCQQVDFPGVQVEQMTVGLHGHEANYRGRQMFSKQLAASFIELANGATFRGLLEWKEAVVGTRSGNGAYRKDYSSLVTIGVLDPTGVFVNTRKVFFVWPTDIQQIQLDGTQGSNAMLISVNFSFDHAETLDVRMDTHGEEATVTSY